MKATSFTARLRRVTRRLSPPIRRHRRHLVTGSFGTLLVVACRLAYPWPLRGVLEVAFNEHKQRSIVGLVPSWGDPIAVLVGVFLVIVLLQGVGELIQKVSFARFSIGLVRDVRAEALAGVKRRPASDEEVGDLIARVIGDTARFKSGLKGVLIRMTQSGTFFVGVCVMLFLNGPAARARLPRRRDAAARRRRPRRVARQPCRAAAAQEGGRAGGADARGARGRRRGHGRARRRREARRPGRGQDDEDGGHHDTRRPRDPRRHDLRRAGARRPRRAHGNAAPRRPVHRPLHLLQAHNPTVRLGRQAMRLGRVLASAERLVKLMDRRPPKVRARAPDGLFAAWSGS